MKRAFVRGLWGGYQEKPMPLKRPGGILLIPKNMSKVEYYRKLSRYKIDNDLQLVKKNPFEGDFVSYIFGEDNYKKLVDMGFNCKLLDKKPSIYPLMENWWIHKLEILKAAMEDFDEICFMDWDCIPVNEMPVDFWDVMNLKMDIQVPLRLYKHPQINWRKRRYFNKYTSCAGFIYIRKKQIAEDLMQLWKDLKLKDVTEEYVLSKYIDGVMGGWKGIERYWDVAEPDYFKLFIPLGQVGDVWPKEKLAQKKQYLWHISYDKVEAIMNNMNKGTSFIDSLKAEFPEEKLI